MISELISIMNLPDIGVLEKIKHARLIMYERLPREIWYVGFELVYPFTI